MIEVTIAIERLRRRFVTLSLLFVLSIRVDADVVMYFSNPEVTDSLIAVIGDSLDVEEYHSLLVAALEGGHGDVASYLFDISDARSLASSKRDPVIMAIIEDEGDVLNNLLMFQRFDPSGEVYHGYPYFHFAAERHQFNTCMSFIRYGADVMEKNIYGNDLFEMMLADCFFHIGHLQTMLSFARIDDKPKIAKQYIQRVRARMDTLDDPCGRDFPRLIELMQERYLTPDSIE